MLRKMKNVFAIFKEHREDVALLWRPHPLLENTLRSMRGGLLDEYEEIVRQYKEEGWGIFDDTADMNRSVTLSDAYYGDGSSMVWLYQKAGKLAMIQDVDIIDEE